MQTTAVKERVSMQVKPVEQTVVGDKGHEHFHPPIVHTHDHYHVSHVHAGDESGDRFEHRVSYHSHEHNHSGLVHAHRSWDEETERREHERTAHIHDHAPDGVDPVATRSKGNVTFAKR